MLNVGNILKSLSQYDLNGQNQPLLALSNFLHYHGQDNELFAADLIQTFFQDCLEYPHWQQNKKILAQEVYQIIESTCRAQAEIFDYSSIQWPDQMQIITIDQGKDWQDAIHSYLTYQHRGGEKFRILYDELLGKMLALILKPTGELLIRMFGNQFFIRDGALTPLREDLHLMYDLNLELATGVTHKVETGSYITTRFEMKDSELFGTIVRGYFFQHLQDLNGEHYSTHAKLFYSLKRIESHFLKKETNPYYQNLTLDLEHTVKMIRLGDQSFIKNTPDMISRAQNALDYVFPNDKLLSLLLKDLRHTYSSGQVNTKQTAVKQTGRDKSWNQQEKGTHLLPENPTELIELTKKQHIPQTLL